MLKSRMGPRVLETAHLLSTMVAITIIIMITIVIIVAEMLPLLLLLLSLLLLGFCTVFYKLNCCSIF